MHSYGSNKLLALREVKLGKAYPNLGLALACLFIAYLDETPSLDFTSYISARCFTFITPDKANSQSNVRSVAKKTQVSHFAQKLSQKDMVYGRTLSYKN